jgi:hypothetical protein
VIHQPPEDARWQAKRLVAHCARLSQT